jgi:hypothetical protein
MMIIIIKIINMFLWLSRGILKTETEDQALLKKYHATKVLQTVTHSKCRL